MAVNRSDGPETPRSLQQHWEDVYAARDPGEASWYQTTPTASLSLIRASSVSPSTKIIDIGGGASTLADHLLGEGFSDITVLDISANAIAGAQQRLGPAASRVQWITADITTWQPETQYGIWHDRAVFHFLTNAGDRDAYRAALTRALLPGGSAIFSTFSLDGPERCSGLPVQRYSPESLAAELGCGLTLVESVTEDHHTPAGAIQRFVYCRFTR
ncbi:hypothetical protein GCM10011507_23050 [Edaphobacter acidisoli]|uniref:Methyltransferase domain-containing protein n=1 Tax=Edaphobacter acidisoli TaxID=2040573 RepID=A0A916RXC1_9BACT|nr:class I SAM-dependent methyltransferase [Edaphobacter acidisoli]GGA70872.1 hypothetical protein GCM10011507_23050 [Edaphobacter acidisoli]